MASTIEAMEFVPSVDDYPQERLLFSGLTATSKTTYSKLIAQCLERPYINAASELWQLAGFTGVPGSDLWVSESGHQLQQARQGDQLDRRLDQLLLERTSQTPNAVVDAWAMPWLWEGEAIRIMVKADLDTRVKRCLESASSDMDLTATRAEQVITEKDDYTRDLFHRLYGFDLFSDHEIFDLILDTSGFIENTHEKKGVEIATGRLLPVAMRAILATNGEPANDSHDQALANIKPFTVKLEPSL